MAMTGHLGQRADVPGSDSPDGRVVPARSIPRHPAVSIDTVSIVAGPGDAARTAGERIGMLIRKGLLSVAFASSVAVAALSVATSLPPVGIAVGAAGIALFLGADMATIPAHRRGASARPGWRLLGLAAATALALALFDGSLGEDERGLLLTVTATALAYALASWLHRALTRRVRTMIVGPADAVEALERQWADRDDVVVAGVCDWEPGDVAAGAVDGIVREVPRLMRASGATRVAITGVEALSDPTMRHLAWGLQRVDVECLVVTAMSDYVEYVRPARVGEQLALVLESPRDHALSKAVKAVAERTLAALLLIALAPLLVVIAVMVRLDSPGPAIFRQIRSGRDGVPFCIYKFRTMVDGAERQVQALQAANEGSGPLFKLMSDPRVTRLGAVLRRTSLDELPQLFNVLLGDMALVGPRPALESETAAYSPWVWRRLHVRPGVTGLWQVSGRSTLDWDESIRLDLKYVNNWSLWLDLRILGRTVVAVLNRKGAW